jgi:hypothetical protein
MSDEDAKQIHFLHEGLSGLRGPGLLPPTEGFAPVARVWYDTSLQCLNAADFTGQPALSNIQTLAIATLLNRNLGESQRDYILLGLAINSARTIGMDWLGCENDATRTSVSCDLWADRSTRELGRRLWWTLVICDWLVMILFSIVIGRYMFRLVYCQSFNLLLVSTDVVIPFSGSNLPPCLCRFLISCNIL